MEKQTDTNKDLYTQAFAYLVNGYSIIPLKKDKRPALSSWKKYQTAPPTEDEVTRWWKQSTPTSSLSPSSSPTPTHLLGIVTGKVSGISVVDIDNDKGAQQDRADQMLKKFPPTYTVHTGNGGYQLYYQYQPDLSISANSYPNLPGVDIRSDGGYVVAPPSVTDYFDAKLNRKLGGEYTILDPQTPTSFPSHLFPSKKPRKTLTAMLNVSSGSRNDSITSFIGKLLQASTEDEWESEVFPAVERANKTYSPPLPAHEVRSTFDSIVARERERRQSLIISPFQFPSPSTDGDANQSPSSSSPTTTINIRIRKNKGGVAYKDMANVLAVLSQHPYYKDTIRYNDFRQEIEYNGEALEDADITKIQYFMQTDAELHGINKEAVYAAISHYAFKNRYDEVKDWLTSLTWDKTPRLASWLSRTLGIEDTPYHAGIGAQWLMGSVKRILLPGCVFDYVLVLVGPQGVGKTSFFRILGGKWYKSYTGQVESKDFYLALRGATIVDLDEGATLYRSEAIKMKSIITETHDEYRAPYDRVMKKYPRRFVFSTSTNDTEPFRDITGNRRYWTVDFSSKVDFKWLEENRDQLYAEAYHCFMNKIALPEVPMEEATRQQEAHLPDDSWTDLVVHEVRKSADYCQGNEEYATTIIDIYTKIFPEESVARLGKNQEMRLAHILRKFLGLDKKQVTIDNERVVRWKINPSKIVELKEQHAKKTIVPLDNF